MTDDEKRLLAIFKQMYWETLPNVRCQNVHYLKKRWPGVPTTLPALNNAIHMLVATGHLMQSESGVCLTDVGLRAIGAPLPKSSEQPGAA
jgi:hypothetical protein